MQPHPDQSIDRGRQLTGKATGQVASCKRSCRLTLLLTGMLSLLGQFPAQAQDVNRGSDQKSQIKQQLLINPMESTSSISPGSWKIQGMSVTKVDTGVARVGRSTLLMRGENALQPGAKADITVATDLSLELTSLQAWMKVEADSNINKAGLQLVDAEGEVLLAVEDVSWSGWSERNFDCQAFKPAYPQATKNQTVDLPVKELHVVWFTKTAGETWLEVDGISGIAHGEASDKGLQLKTFKDESIAPGENVRFTLVATNHTNEDRSLSVDLNLQRTSTLQYPAVPHPRYGTNHAQTAASWLLLNDERLPDESCIDQKVWTASSVELNNENQKAAVLIDLGEKRQIERMTWTGGQANQSGWCRVSTSIDGSRFEDVPSLQRIKLRDVWGTHEFPLGESIEARWLLFEQESFDGKPGQLTFPSEISIYDGLEDETWSLPRLGDSVAEDSLELRVPAHSFVTKVIELPFEVDEGAFLLSTLSDSNGQKELDLQTIFCDLSSSEEMSHLSSRIGMNAAQQQYTTRLKDLGVGFIRFENGKWPFCSSEPHRYSFTGNVAPWHLDFDGLFQEYDRAGMETLTYLFQTPEWATSAPDNAPNNMRASFPPRSLDLYGEFCFQMAARYGSKTHPDQELLTEDKRSGLGLVKYYELWNEPNLNPYPDATWGGWAAPLETYYAMMRYGAEAVRRADPDAKITSAGYAGITPRTVDRLRTYTYEDGKHPVDFIDILNVHFYSGLVVPETCRTDGNANITSETTFPENLRALVAWRDQYAKGKPIWMTETGYDSAGSFGTDETEQAARLPRVVMLSLANGIDKVFVYRESGSTPSKHASSGILRNDGTRKPSWYTMGTMIRQMDGCEGYGRRLPHPNPDVWIFEWDRNGEPLITAWTTEGETRFDVDLGACQVVDAFGGGQMVEQTDELKLSPFPQYLSQFDDPTELQHWREEATLIEKEKQVLQERVAELKKYLFDFGGSENVADFTLYEVRTPFTAVLSDSLFKGNTLFGFDKPAMQDDDRKWMKNDALQRDGTKVNDHTFIFEVEPGDYEMMVSISPFQETGTLEIGGINDEPLEVIVEKETPTKPISFKVEGESARISIQLADGYGHFRWIQCVERLKQ